MTYASTKLGCQIETETSGTDSFFNDSPNIFALMFLEHFVYEQRTLVIVLALFSTKNTAKSSR